MAGWWYILQPTDIWRWGRMYRFISKTKGTKYNFFFLDCTRRKDLSFSETFSSSVLHYAIEKPWMCNFSFATFFCYDHRTQQQNTPHYRYSSGINQKTICTTRTGFLGEPSSNLLEDTALPDPQLSRRRLSMKKEDCRIRIPITLERNRQSNTRYPYGF